jgi:hypothetical protein
VNKPTNQPPQKRNTKTKAQNPKISTRMKETLP